MPAAALAKIDQTSLKLALVKKRDEAKRAFEAAYPKSAEWLARRKIDLAQLRRPAQLVAGVSLTGSLLLSSPNSVSLTSGESKTRLAYYGFVPVGELFSRLKNQLATLVPTKPGHADLTTEAEISRIIEAELGIRAVPELEGERLNHSFGYIGKEQHLKRFPGDSIYLHDEEQSAGIAPGLGGWGYFVYSRQEMTDQDVMKEKYYFAVQTLYLPNWKTDWPRLVKWYKHRKMLVINTETGQAVVGVVADAGPAEWIGKQFGGSPEVIRDLGLTTTLGKTKVLLYFVDDPENKIPLGPVKQRIGLAELEKA